MTERSWCPSLSPQPGAAALSKVITADVFAGLERTGGDAVSARRDASVAANNSVSATEAAGALTAAFQRRFHKFDAALVSSKVNRSLWPCVSDFAENAGGGSGSPVSPDTAVCLGVSTIGQTPISAPAIALPSDAVGDFVSLLARRAAERQGTAAGDSVKGLVAFPPSETVASLSDVVTSVLSSKTVVEELRSLSIAGASAAKADNTLARLVAAAKKLGSLTVATSDITNTVVPMLDAVRASEVRHLSLAGSQLGFGSGDLDREGLTSSFCDVAKVSKFLTSLDVADANVDTDFIVALLGAFADSDTKLLPEELGEDPDEVTRWTLEGRVSTALFLGRRNGTGEDDDEKNSEAEGEAEEDGDDEDAEEGEEDEAEEDEEDGDAEEEEEGGDADDGEADGDEEDEEEEAESLKKKKAEKQRLLREKQELREKLKRIKKELKLLVRTEAQERAKLLQAYCQATDGVVAVNNGPIVNRRAEERQRKKEEYCTRRSGWSHLESLVLRGNPVGDRGCKPLARVLREEVPLTDDEVTQRKEVADAKREGFGEELGASRIAVLHAEQKAWRALLHTAQCESPAPRVAPRSTSISATVSDPDEEDEYAKEAPPVLLTNVERASRGIRNNEVTDDTTDDGDEAASGGEADGDEAADESSPEEQKEWQDWVAQSVPQIPVEPVKKGMGTVRFVDVSSCGIGRKGLRALAAVLTTNKVLETLRLRHNPVGSAVIAKKGAPQEEAGAVSSEFAEFAAMLSVNGGLRHLDFSYCRLTCGDVRAIAAALQQNTALVTLELEGNQLGMDEPYQQQRHEHSYLYELWMSVARPGSAVRGLSLDHNEIAACLWPEEVAALAAVCGQLSCISLSHVGLRQRHLQAWSAALPATDASYCPTVRTLYLSRNELVCEADGAALGELLQRFTALETLSLKEHPLLGSAGVAAALENVPATLRHLDCSATGLTTSVVGAARNPVLPPAAVAQLTHLLLGDVEAPEVAAVGEWIDFIKACAPQRLRCLSLWSRGMAGKEGQVVPHLLDLAQSCASLTYVDGGFQPQLHVTGAAGASFLEMERLLLPRRMQSALESQTA